MDGHFAICADITWANPSKAGNDVEISVEKCETKKWHADANLSAQVKSAYSILDHLKHTQLCNIPSAFRPLTSRGSRQRRVSMATFLCGRIRDALNDDGKNQTNVELVSRV